MTKLHKPLFCSLVLIVVAGLMCESAAAQMPWRGHYMRRDGLFHVERYHWGGGITANGASVLNTGITAFAPIVAGVLGKDASDDGSDRGAREFRQVTLPADYVIEQNRANTLLDRTANLVNNKPPLAASIVNPPPPNGKSRGIALTIGVNRLSSAHYSPPPAVLRGCVADAVDVRNIARDAGFETQEPITDSQATLANVTSAIERIAGQLNSGDIFLLHFSGHGSQVPDRNGDERTADNDGQDETLCLFDGMLIDDELGRLWTKFRPGVRVLALFDSCHSGTATKNIQLQKEIAAKSRNLSSAITAQSADRLLPRQLTREEATGTYNKNRTMYDQIGSRAGGDGSSGASVLLISGCQDREVSGDLPNNGVFTGTLKQVWSGGRFNGNYAEFHRQILSSMPANQRPNLFTADLKDPKFLAQKPFTVAAPR